jgi:chitin disaccharide deacetylase
MICSNKIIVNADDYGYSLSVNRAILQSFQRCLITSTSLMANMAGFEDAIAMYHRQPLLQGKVGVHLNLTEGYSLSETIRRCPRFCNAEGQFIYRREQPIFFLSRQEKKAVFTELKMQLDRVLASGIAPAHLDSHHHVHTEWAIARIVRQLGREYSIGRIRLTRNMGRSGAFYKNIYKTIFNRWHRGLSSTDYFGDIEDMHFSQNAHPRTGKLIEIMVHPLFSETGELVDMDRRNLQEKLQTYNIL